MDAHTALAEKVAGVSLTYDRRSTQEELNRVRSRSTFLAAVFLTAMAGPVSGQSIAGIGATLAKEGESLVIKAIAPDSAAARSHSLQVGDRILAIAQGDGAPVPARDLNLGAAVQLIRGPEGTDVRLTIVPTGKDESQARVVMLTRGALKELARWGDGNLLAQGTPAPDVRWVRLEGGKSERLRDLAGQVVVLEFWATWCGPCQEQMATLQTFLKKYPGWSAKVALVTASVDENPDAARSHLARKGWNTTHNAWVEPEAIKAFHVNALPTTYVISRKGMVVHAGQVADIPAIVNRLIEEG